MLAWAVAGAAFGFVAGSLIGAIASALAGAVLDWQHHLAFTMGVSQSLLPLGGQTATLETIRDGALWLVPVSGVAVAVIGAVVSALAGGLVAATLNRLGAWPEMDLADASKPKPLASG